MADKNGFFDLSRTALTRRTALKGLAAGAGLAVAPGFVRYAQAQSSAPIKIGFLAPVTGGAAAVGKDMTNGFAMYLDEIGNQMAGRKVEVIVEDTQGQPAPALAKLRKLVESDRVHILAGLLFAHVGYALAPKVDEYKIPMVYPVVSADDLTQRKPARWVVRTGWTSSSIHTLPGGSFRSPAAVLSCSCASRSSLLHLPRTTLPSWKTIASPLPVNMVSGTGLPAGSR